MSQQTTTITQAPCSRWMDVHEKYNDTGYINNNAAEEVSPRFRDGHDHCAHLFQGAFLNQEEDMGWFWRPITLNDDTGDTDDESEIDDDEYDVAWDDNDGHVCFTTAAAAPPPLTTIQTSEEEIDIKLNVQEGLLEAEDYDASQESFERSLYEDFRNLHDEILLEQIWDGAVFRVVSLGFQDNEAEKARIYDREWKNWNDRVANRKEWFDAAMAHRFEGHRPF